MAWILLGLSLLLNGCRHSGLDRLPMHGTVKTTSGEKFNGSITFLPAAGRKGPAATASVTNGEYRFNRENGPTAGSSKIIMRRLITRDEEMKAITSRARKPQSKTEWILTADISDDGKCLRDFVLEN